MTRWLLQLAGIETAPGESVVSLALRLRNEAHLPWIAAGALALALLAWHTYRNANLPARARTLLAGLRIAALLLLCAVLLRPVLAATVESTLRRTLVILADRSASMNIQDPRVEPDDLRRAGIATGRLHPARGLHQPFDDGEAVARIGRIDLARAALENRRLDLLARLARNCNLEPWSFGSSCEPLAPDSAPPGSPTQAFDWTRRLAAATDRTTALGDAIRHILDRKRGQPVAGLFIVTDGASNTGIPPSDAAAAAARDRIPLFLYGVGLTSPRDAIVANVFGPEIAFAEEEVSVNVRVRSQGLAARTAKLVLRLGDKTVDEREIHLAASGEEIVPMTFTPADRGEFELSASIQPIDGETLTDNNRSTRKLRVIEDKIRVLLVEQTPRWEFQHLQAILLRDRRIDLKMVLLEGDPTLAKAENSPFLESFPADKKQLYAFDLVILGDVDPAALAPVDFEHLAEFVSRFGGSLLLLAGKRHNPLAYARTELEKLLPVELPDALAPPDNTPGPFGIELTAAGRRSPLLELEGDDKDPDAGWACLPPLQWISPVGRAKPAAQVLLAESATPNRPGSSARPLLALQQYGVGQVLFVGSDNLWRWRRNEGERLHRELWARLVQRLALPHLLGGSKRTQLTADREQYAAGDRVTLYARLYSETFEPIRDPVIQATVAWGTGSDRRDIQLHPIPEQPGMYCGEFVATTTGPHRFAVAHDPETRLDFHVSEPQFESGESAMNERLLRALAEQSGGALLREEDLHRLPDLVAARNEKVRAPLEAEVWSSPLIFLLALALFSTEWILRKRWHLR